MLVLNEWSHYTLSLFIERHPDNRKTTSGVLVLKLHQRLWSKMPLIPLWDAIAFLIWLISFGRKTIRWRGIDYYIEKGMLVPVIASSSSKASD